MPLHTTEAIVLRTYPLGDTDRIVVFLTRDRGKKRGVAKAARRSRRRFGGALEPLTRVRVAYVERENRELVMLNYAEPLQSPLAAHDADALGHASYFAELIDEWAPQDHANEKLFRLGAATLAALAADVPTGALARYFEYWLMRLEGVYPSLAACDICGHPLESGGVSLTSSGDALVCLSCAPRSEADVSPAGLAFLRAAAQVSPGGLAAVTLSERVGQELERVHRLLLARHLDREPRSLRVIREMAATDRRQRPPSPHQT